MTLRRWAVILGLIGMGAARASADETPFGYIYPTDLLPKGHWEYEQWHTLRSGKINGSYQSLDLRNEVEYGSTAKFQAASYLNSSYLYTHDVVNPDDPTTNLEIRSIYDT